MRRTTSALTTAILGVVLTASIVAAQQPPVPDDGPQAQTSAAAASSQLYGMNATRGARYLMRNGLDYLSYQEYDRALKFLRQAQVRQKELNDAEKRALNQGIESAQRGLRSAADAESPYALSDRSRPRNGFVPAKPETRVANNTDPINPPSRRVKTSPPANSSLLGSDGDDRGEPIRLTSGEAPLDGPIPETNARPRSTNAENAGAVASSEAGQSRNTPEISLIPTVAQLPDLTEANGSERPVAAPKRSATVRQPAKIPTASVAGRVAARVIDDSAPEPLPIVPVQFIRPAEMADADPKPQPGSRPMRAGAPAVENSQTAGPYRLSSFTSTMGPVPEATSGQEGAKQTLPSLVAPGDAPTALAPAPTQAAAAEAMPATTSVVADSDPVPRVTTNAKVIDTKTIPTSATADESSQAVDLAAPVHQETAGPVPASTPGSVQDGSSATPTATAEPLPAMPGATPGSVQDGLAAVPTAAAEPLPGAGDELPPLPADLGSPATAAPEADKIALQPAAAQPASSSDDALPPLPADLGRSDPAASASVVPPAQTLDPPASSTTASGNGNEQPSQTGATPPASIERESPTPVPVGSEPQPVPTTADGGIREADIGSAPPLSSASPGASAAPDREHAVAAVPSPAELPPLPGSDKQSAPVSQPYPSTNPNLESQAASTATNAAETAPISSSLPPAIADRPRTSSSDSLLPDRPTAPSTLRPDLMREVEKIARNQEDALRRQAENPQQPAAPPRDTIASDLRTQTQLDISRAPSPAEARPIKAIPVPEDWVPLQPRDWTPQRKYWAAAATCHLPLYFQDPVLERYGHSVEQFVGPVGRFLTYPLDDPTQSTQRNQILQPFFSVGLMGLQIIAWPYNLIMDPPWEAQYDLGYYRPGDSIPTDTYWLPLHGYGPPLRGSNY